jgi:uncharacterized protein YcfJ
MFSKWSLPTLVVGMGVAASASADHGQLTQIAYAPIIDVEPLVRLVTVNRPREECWLETTVVPSPRATGAVLAGGLLGGVIGHQLGSGRSNNAMTVLGTLVGSAVASNAVAKRAAYAGQEVTTERCEIVNQAHTEERIDGYRVTYEYMGQRYATVMPEPPRGDRMRLHVTVRAAY